MAGSFYQAYVEIIPVAKGFKGNLEKELGGLDSVSSRAGGQSGGIFSRAFSGALRGIAVAGSAAIGAASAGLGATLSKGFERLQGIERARNLLEGIGNDAKTVEEVMTNALDAVRGTAFGLDEAAQVAASSVAAGVKPGQDLTRYLGLTGDAATITGRSMGELGAIFNKVTAQGKAQNDTLQQLAESGIPIYQYLADQVGVTAQEIFDLASDGEISSEMLLTAIETNIAGAALKAGETTQGAFANVGAAISRVGANILNSTFTQLPGFFTSLIEAIDPLAEAAKGIGEELGTALTPVFAQIVDLVPIIFESFVGLLPLFIELIDLVVTLFPTFLDLVMPLIPLITDLAGLFVDLLDAALPFVSEILAGFMSFLEPLVPILIDFAQGAMKPLTDIMHNLFNAFEPLIAVGLPLFFDFLTLISEVLQDVLGWISDNTDIVFALAVGIGAAIAAFQLWIAITNAAKFAMLLFNAVLALNPIGLIVLAVAALVAGLTYFFTATETGQELWAKFVEGLQNAWGAISQWFSDLWTNIVEWFQSIPELLVQAGKDLLNGFLDGIKLAFKLLEFWFIDLPVHIIAFFLSAGRWLYDNGDDILRGLWEGIVTGYELTKKWFQDLPGNLANFFSNAWTWLVEGGQAIIEGLLEGVKIWWEFTKTWFEERPEAIQDFFSNAGEFLLQIGKDIINGLLNGLTNAWTAVKNWVSDKVDWIINKFKDALKIKSPSKVFYEYGQMIGEGLRLGMDSMSKSLDTSVTSMISLPDKRNMSSSGLFIPDTTNLASGVYGGNAYNGGGMAVNYYAAPNKSFDAEQELLLAMRRVQVMA